MEYRDQRTSLRRRDKRISQGNKVREPNVVGSVTEDFEVSSDGEEIMERVLAAFRGNAEEVEASD